MSYFTIERLHIHIPKEKKALEVLLASQGLALEADVDYTVGAFRSGELIGTCSKADKVIKCLAVDSNYQGEGLAAPLISAITDRLFEEGKYHYFVFTMPNKTEIFEALNFRLLYKGTYAALLEGGIYSIERRLKELKKNYAISDTKDKAALVMNCNPFTLGHLHLVEQAASQNKEVLLFVVEEERSVFSFSERFQLVRQGVAHLNNVQVLPGTEYIISSSTFPSYFLREKNHHTEAFMEVDAGVFCTFFCTILGIKRRYVGQEPYCNVTAGYNKALLNSFALHGLELKEVSRLENQGQAISASKVRQLIKEGSMAEVQQMVPQSTWNFLNETKEGREAVERVKKSNAPH